MKDQPISHTPAPLLRFEKEREVCARVGYSRAYLWATVKAGKFPAPIKIGERAVAWNSDEVNAWMQAKMAARQQGAV